MEESCAATAPYQRLQAVCSAFAVPASPPVGAPARRAAAGSAASRAAGRRRARQRHCPARPARPGRLIRQGRPLPPRACWDGCAGSAPLPGSRRPRSTNPPSPRAARPGGRSAKPSPSPSIATRWASAATGARNTTTAHRMPARRRRCCSRPSARRRSASASAARAMLPHYLLKVAEQFRVWEGDCAGLRRSRRRARAGVGRAHRLRAATPMPTRRPTASRQAMGALGLAWRRAAG